MGGANAITSCVTLTGAEYMTMLAEAHQLKRENERLRAALKSIADDDPDFSSGSGHTSAIMTARAALDMSPHSTHDQDMSRKSENIDTSDALEEK